MGWQFRRSRKILPGVRVTVSKRGLSVSGGGPGIRKSLSTTGRSTTTFRIPGTGLFWRKTRTRRRR